MIRLLWAMLFFVSPSAQAESLSPTVMTTLGDKAETIVRGQVLVQRLEHDHNGVWTIATVRVTETLQGNAPLIQEVRVPGGKLNQMEVMVARAPRLLPGDDVLLFLKGDRIVGMGEGAFVVHDERIWQALDAWTFGKANERRAATASLALTQVRSVLTRDGASSALPSSIAR